MRDSHMAGFFRDRVSAASRKTIDSFGYPTYPASRLADVRNVGHLFAMVCLGPPN